MNKLMWIALVTCSLLALPRPGHAYIAVSGERLTISEIFLEFPTIMHLEVEKVDLDKGVIVFKVVQTLGGKAPGPKVRHVITDATMKERFKAVAPGTKVLSMLGSIDNRSIHFSAAGWYLTNPVADTERVAQFRDDLNAVFVGEPKDRIADAETLLLGGSIRVPVIPKGAKEKGIWLVKYQSDFPHRRELIPTNSAKEVAKMDELSGLLSSKEEAPKGRGAYLLRQYPEALPKFKQVILALLTSNASLEVKTCLVESLSALPFDADVAQALGKELKNEDRFYAAQVAKTLGKYGPRADNTLKDLAAALADRNYDFDYRPHRAAEAAEAIILIAGNGPLVDKAVQFLRSDKLLNDQRPDAEGTRSAAARHLGRSGPGAKAALGDLEKHLKDSVAFTRIASAEAIVLIGAEEKLIAKSHQTLEKELTSKDLATVAEAVKVVGRLPKAPQGLKDLAAKVLADPANAKVAASIKLK